MRRAAPRSRAQDVGECVTGFALIIPVALTIMLAHKTEQRYVAVRTCSAVAMVAVLLVTSCGAPGFATAPIAHAPETPGDQPRCRLAANQENPLVTEWPATEKANLEARLRQGSIIVSYSGCTLRMLPRCRARGDYVWRRTTTSTDVIEIRNADELYAKMPLGAVSLEGELQRSGRLAVQTTASGQLQLSGFDPMSVAKGAECEGATHVIGALSVGAFKLRSGGAARAGGRAEVSAIGSARAGSESEETIVREAGAPARCEQSTESAPHAECASPLQMFLQALPASIADRGPTGTVKVKFLPVRPDQDWEVMVGDRPLCKTPCERWVDPAMPYTLKYDPGFFQRNQYIEVPDLRMHQASERVEVRAQPQSMGEFVGGIMLTTFGGAAVLAGTAFTAIGCSQGTGLCTAGLITLPAGILAVIPGIWMMLDSKGTVRISPMAPQSPVAGH
jgi:transposase